MAYINVKVAFKGAWYDAEIDAAVNPMRIAEELAQTIADAPAGGEYLLALRDTSGLVEGASIELVEIAPRAVGKVERRPTR
jgi:hypothetical protein